MIARKLYQNLGDRMSRCFAINPVADGRIGKYRAVGGRATRGERERGKGGSKTGNSRGKKEQGAWKESRRRELIARWIGWDGRMGDGDGNGWRRSSFFC